MVLCLVGRRPSRASGVCVQTAGLNAAYGSGYPRCARLDAYPCDA